jgi:hypothetical protein
MNSTTNDIIDRRGIFGLGFSINNNLDLLNLIVLAFSGILIKVLFAEPTSDSGEIGPASTTIWGYGLTAIALFLMMFMSIYLNHYERKSKGLFERRPIDNQDETSDKNIFLLVIDYLLNNTLPIFLTLTLIIYIIYLNFVYFYRINQNNVTNSYSTYSFFSSLLIFVQLIIISKYMFSLLRNKNLGNKNPGNENPSDKKNNSLLKAISYVLITINFIFVFIIHILLAFFSTDG